MRRSVNETLKRGLCPGTMLVLLVWSAAGGAAEKGPLVLSRWDVTDRSSGGGANRELLCRRVEHAPHVDGRLDDECWKRCRPESDFLDFGMSDFPHQNPDRLIESQSVVRAVWTADTLYLAIECLVPDGRIEWHDVKADTAFTEKEAIGVYLDPGRTRQGYCLFAANPAGTAADAQGVTGKAAYDWHSQWTAKTRKEDKRWTAEMAIPLSALGRPPEAGSEWGANFLRSHAAYHVLSIWSNPRGPVWDDAANFGKIAFVGAEGKKPVSQEAPRPPESVARLAVAMPAKSLPRIDGSLADESWKAAIEHTGFVGSGDLSPRVPHPTAAYYLYDDTNLYLGLRCHADKAKIRLADVATLWEGECVETFWDTTFDRKSHYQLIVGASGLKFQAKKTGAAGGLEMNWKGDWSAETAWEDKAWTAEMVLPLATVGLAGTPADKLWGHTMTRNDSEHKFHSSFSPVVGVFDGHATDRFGFLYFQPAGRPAPVIPLEVRFQPGLLWSDPDERVPWGEGVAWLRAANLAKEDREVEIVLSDADKQMAREKVKMSGGEDRFVPMRARFDKVGDWHLHVVVRADGGEHELSASIEVLPLVTGKLASGLYFTAGREYLATIRLNSEDVSMRDKKVFLGVRPARDQGYRKQERIARLKTGAAKILLALGDLPAGDYALDTGIISDDGSLQSTSSFAFTLTATPYDF